MLKTEANGWPIDRPFIAGLMFMASNFGRDLKQYFD